MTILSYSFSFSFSFSQYLALMRVVCVSVNRLSMDWYWLCLYWLDWNKIAIHSLQNWNAIMIFEMNINQLAKWPSWRVLQNLNAFNVSLCIYFFCITCKLRILVKLLWGLFDNLEGMFVQRNYYRKFVIVFMLPMLQFPDKQ